MRARVATTRSPPVNVRLHLHIPFNSRLFNELDMERYELGKTHALRIEIM